MIYNNNDNNDSDDSSKLIYNNNDNNDSDGSSTTRRCGLRLAGGDRNQNRDSAPGRPLSIALHIRH